MKDFRQLFFTSTAAAMLALPSAVFADAITVDVNVEDVAVISENRRNPGEAHPVIGGDFNQDGYGDLALGSPRSSAFLTDDSGNVFVLYGFNHTSPPAAIDPDETYFDMTASPATTANPLNSTVAVFPNLGFQVMPERGGEFFGASLASGDFDGDGFDDLAIGAPAPLGGVTAGAVYILYGRSDLGGLIEIDVEIFWDRASEIQGIASSPRFGETILMTELNGDGYDDLVISSRGPANEGWVYVVYGRDRNPPFPEWNLERRLVDETVLLTQILGVNAGERLGYSMAGGNFDADTQNELILGAPFWPNSSSEMGRVMVLDNLRPEIPIYNLSTANPYLEVRGELVRQELGHSVAFGEGIIDDGIGSPEDAWVIGAPGYGAGANADIGQVYLLMTASVPTTASLNMPSSADLVINGSTAGARFGETVAVGEWDSVAGPDLAIGQPLWDQGLGLVDTGRVFLFSGAREPLSSPLLPIFADSDTTDMVRFEGFEGGMKAGTGLAFTDFDNYNSANSAFDLIIGTSGEASYPASCNNPTDQAEYIACHVNRFGIRAFIVRSGSVPDVGVNLGANRTWEMLP